MASFVSEPTPCEVRRLPKLNDQGKSTWREAMQICQKERRFASSEGLVGYTRLRQPTVCDCTWQPRAAAELSSQAMHSRWTPGGPCISNISNSLLVVYPYQKLGKQFCIPRKCLMIAQISSCLEVMQSQSRLERVKRRLHT